MASGRLGANDLAATTNTTVYTVPAGKLATFNVSLTNRNATPVAVRLAMAATGTPTASEWLFYDYSLAANNTVERTGLVADATKLLVAYAGATGVSVVAYGLED
jgi:hypothetical protein